MTTQSEDLLKAYARNQDHIKYRRKSIKEEAQNLFALAQILEADPESLSKRGFFVKDGTFVFGSSTISCDTLKKIAEEIKKLEDLRHEGYTLKGRIEREGLGRYISD